ncbi:MAG TPA: leishmanolysin-related zinc metalloendopeptidase [Gemmatimonadales bacterium]|nr:leishmanolysin-related zinc metalloendopeptidase [Gemmatimonadales bacterium]
MPSALRTGAAAIALLALAACTDTQAPDESARPGNPDGGPLSTEPGLRVVSTSAIAAAVLPGFQIDLRFLNGGSASQVAAFETARARWQAAIVGDVPDVEGTIPAKRCGNSFPTPTFNGTVDDILIDVLLQPIDGPGAVLGAAGPCLIRTADNLSLYGIMFFDTEDLGFLEENGILDEVVVHEMGHVLGIGSLWNFGRNLVRGTAADPRFVGPRGVAAYQSIGGKGISIPVEEDGGPGTALSHWDEETFGPELMTGFIGLGSSPLSVMTIESLADMGYQVNPAVAERFRVTGPQPRAEFATASTATVNLIERMKAIRPVATVK